MKSKLLIIVISLIVIIFLIFTYFNISSGSSFVDNGTSLDNNNNWINNNLNVTRNNNFTTLSSNSNFSAWYSSDYTIYNDCIIEWVNYGNESHHDYCLISNKNKTADTPLNFDNLNITRNCHVKLVIKNNVITPYVDGNMKEPIKLETDSKDGMSFRFQINSNGSDICYSNFKIENA